MADKGFSHLNSKKFLPTPEDGGSAQGGRRIFRTAEVIRMLDIKDMEK